MKSKLNIEEFQSRINQTSKIDSAKLKLSPFGLFTSFGGVSKIFYGNFDESTFHLTMNSILSPTFYIIKGKYEYQDNRLNVDYVIEPSNKFQIAWTKIFPVVFLIGINILLLLSNSNLKNTPSEAYIVFNVAAVFLIFFSRWDMKRKKLKLEQKFIETFELK